MKKIIYSTDTDFENILSSLIFKQRSNGQNVSSIVKDILYDVRKNGDEAVLEYTRKFDYSDANIDNIKVKVDELDAAEKKLNEDIKDALLFAYKRIYDFHLKQKPEGCFYTDETGTNLGIRYTPIDSAGVYVPGGEASYPSSALMNIIPAKVAGVSRVVAVVPSQKGVLNDTVLFSLKICGVDEIYKIGGAQAVAALAYGTNTIKAVDKITGPGNAFVAEAKRQVYGTVGIDSIAGPSEILVIADKNSNPNHVALDLLSQAEHDILAQSILITDCSDLANRVLKHIEDLMPKLLRKNITKKSWDDHGIVIVTKDLKEAARISNKFAPEHLEICIENPKDLLPNINHAGAIFMGYNTPEAIGDYIAGPNHILPTDRTCRFSSGLGTADFMKRSTLIECSSDSFKQIASKASIIADAEGLEAHKMSIDERLR